MPHITSHGLSQFTDLKAFQLSESVLCNSDTMALLLALVEVCNKSHIAFRTITTPGRFLVEQETCQKGVILKILPHADLFIVIFPLWKFDE